MKLSKKQINKLAKLSKINITESNAEKLELQIEDLFTKIDEFNKLKVECETMVSPIDHIKKYMPTLQEELKKKFIEKNFQSPDFLMKNKKINIKHNYDNKKINENLKNDHGNAIIEINNKITDGMPIAIKNNIAIKNFKQTCASETLSDYIPNFNATIIEKLKDSNYFIAATTNLDEFANGSSGRNSAFGATEHPFLTNHVPGGSSSGSAYLVGKNIIPLAIGTDTGGSIRQPASFCGVYGLKTTYGLISRYGIMELGSSLDTVGIIGRDIKEMATCLEVIAGPDVNDSVTLAASDYECTSLINNYEIKDKKIAFVKEWLDYDIVDQDIKKSILKQIEDLKNLGAKISEITIPYSRFSFEMYMSIMYPEFLSNVSRIDGIRFGQKFKPENYDDEMYIKYREYFGEEVKKRIIIGNFMLNEENKTNFFFKSQKMREKMTNKICQIFSEYDLIITPTTPNLKIEMNEELDFKTSYLSDAFTIPFNMSGHPAITVPIGQNEKNLPLSLQVVANYGDEKSLFGFASALKEKYV